MSARRAYLRAESANGATSLLSPPELENRGSDRDAVAVLDLSHLNRLPVQTGAVRRAEVREGEGIGLARYLRVTPRSPRIPNDDVAVGEAADRRHALRQSHRSFPFRFDDDEGRAAGGRGLHSLLVFDERGRTRELAGLQPVVDAELDAGGPQQVPVTFGCMVADDLFELAGESLLRLLEALRVRGGYREDEAVRRHDVAHAHRLACVHLAKEAFRQLDGLKPTAECLCEEALDEAPETPFEVVEDRHGRCRAGPGPARFFILTRPPAGLVTAATIGIRAGRVAELGRRAGFRFLGPVRG